MKTATDPIEDLARSILDALADLVDEEHVTDEEWNDPEREAAAARDSFRTSVRTVLTEWLSSDATVDTIAQVLAVAPGDQEVYRYGARAIAAALVASLAPAVVDA